MKFCIKEKTCLENINCDIFLKDKNADALMQNTI